MSFAVEVEKVLAVEAGYANDPLDSGGETIWGITKAVARAFGYEGAMSLMTREQAKAIYRKRYWDSMLLDRIEALAGNVAAELFDTGVNQGVEAASRYFQRALNVLNQNGKMYPDIAVDGRIGDMTIAAFREFLRERGARGAVVMFRALNSLQGAKYIELAEAREKDERFVYGWLLNRVN